MYSIILFIFLLDILLFFIILSFSCIFSIVFLLLCYCFFCRLNVRWSCVFDKFCFAYRGCRWLLVVRCVGMLLFLVQYLWLLWDCASFCFVEICFNNFWCLWLFDLDLICLRLCSWFGTGIQLWLLLSLRWVFLLSCSCILES